MHPARAPQVNPGATEPLDVLRGNAARIPYLEGIGPRRRFQVGGSGPSVRGIQPHAPRPAPGLARPWGNGRRRSTTERGHKTEPNFYRRRNNDDRHADC